MFEVGFSHVEQALPRHRRVLHLLLIRHKRQHRIHQRTLARRARRLNHHPQRPGQLAAHRRQVPHQLIGLLAHQPARLIVRQNPLNQLGRLEQLQRRFGLQLVHLRPRLHRQSLGNRLVLQLLHGQQHPPQVHLQDAFINANLSGSLRDVVPARLGAVQVQRVHMERIPHSHHQVHLQHVHAQVLRQPPNPVATPRLPLTQHQRDLAAVLALLDRHRQLARRLRHRARRQ